ncbi:PAS domain S-box protein [Methylobacterium sp.]|uniref:PAS domain S-box protein n=1 Tax=Methylobacterium sp. TaxID=409 RepID=UPI002637F8FC|nr:PAS domain S-box protein [Methylobacterium sp.]MDB5646139.1 signal transduction histidine kinase [Methylobacterium sp.]
MSDLEQILKRQRVLADFGEFTLSSDDIDAVLTEACRLVGEALGTGRAKILEIQNDGQCLFVRAGIGWAAGVVGHLRLPMNEYSSETFAISESKPLFIRDIREEPRFGVPPFMKEAGVIALANVPIRLPGGKAYGLLQVDATEPRDFGPQDTEFLRTYASILGPVIDRLQTVRTLRFTEERFRLVVENARDYAIFTTDAQDRITDWYAGAEDVYGWSAEEATGQPAAIIFTPEDLMVGQDATEIGTALRDGSAPNVRWHLRKDGTRVFIEGVTTTLRSGDGTLRGFLKIGQDVTERREADEALRESEARFRQFGEASSDLLWIRNAGTLQFEYVSPAFEAIYGRSRESVVTGDTLARWADLIHPEDREGTLAALRQVQGGMRVTHEFRIVRASDGEMRWIETSDFPLLDDEGRVHRIAGIAKDMTDQKAGAARLTVLVDELQHRSRNLLGVVAAVASRTLDAGGSATETFETRLKALSRAQGLLSRFGSDTVEVGALVRAELAAHTDADPPKVVVSGPDVHLTARQVQNFALALHELTTNAVKYGALKGVDGELAVDWTVQRDPKARRWLCLTWTESGVAVPPETVTRRGYGRELIENALSYALQARTTYELGRDGVRCRIELPLA